MLGGKHHGVDPVRRAIGVVFDCDLAFGIGTDKRQLLVATHHGVVFHQTVRQEDRQGHKATRFIASKAKHHALVTGAA